MGRFIAGADRTQLTLLPEAIDDYVGKGNPVRVVDAFVEALDLADLDFDGVISEDTGRPSYHPATILKIYIFGYLNQVQSSRGLERECRCNLELIWLTGRLAPDFKTIADFRRDNGPAIRKVCQQFVALCRGIDLLDASIVAIDGSKSRRHRPPIAPMHRPEPAMAGSQAIAGVSADKGCLLFKQGAVSGGGGPARGYRLRLLFR
jgi:transposase